MFAAYLFWHLHVAWWFSFGISLVVTVAITAALGVTTYQLVMRPLGRVSARASIVSTLGIFMVLQGIAPRVQTAAQDSQLRSVDRARHSGGVSLG